VGALSSALHSVGIEDAWTPERAGEWWRAHPPAPAPEASAAPDPDPFEETLSQVPVRARRS
jgi:hypothetical protein